jgi:hypothetical protein
MTTFTNRRCLVVPVLSLLMSLGGLLSALPADAAVYRWDCPSPANSYAPFGWDDLPFSPPDWVIKNRWTRTTDHHSRFHRYLLRG